MNAVTDRDYADEGTGAESSSHEGEDTGPESSNDETRIGSRFQWWRRGSGSSCSEFWTSSRSEKAGTEEQELGGWGRGRVEERWQHTHWYSIIFCVKDHRLWYLWLLLPPPPEHPKSCNMYCYCRCRCLCFCGVVVELHTLCICVCVELKCYSGASRSNRGGNELGGGERGVFSNRGYYAM